MALQRMILVPPKLWEKRCQTLSQPPVKTILKSKDHRYNKWTRSKQTKASCIRRLFRNCLLTKTKFVGNLC